MTESKNTTTPRGFPPWREFLTQGDEAMSPTELSRRTLFARAATVAAAAVVATPALASSLALAEVSHTDAPTPVKSVSSHSLDDDRQIDRFWVRRLRAIAKMRQCSLQRREASARLPEWAAPGPGFLRHDGSLSGALVGWPAIEGAQPPTPGYLKNVRLSPYEIKQRFKIRAVQQGRQRAEQQRAAEMAEFKERRRRQRLEEIRVGLPRLERACNAAARRLLAIEDEILELKSHTPQTMAAGLLIDVSHEAQDSSFTVENSGIEKTARVLEILRPGCRGLVRQHVDELLDNRSKSIFKMAFFPGPVS